ncbi:4'-phosphopantetheinyl transferase superfamily protein [Kribbella albertanoniae]|uniref:4'-phosphopantetheinyl transferase superfamily protein n=1 Tax=Kribbella albertanoniae TaxID=1266829 RepID=A0A4R4QDK2_9ACTN|nr:4'-phosphopantetheinyl transferase superfamily protein [Kribbella albertanoniae]TDC33538.1 4'-phosphopantetheinyl transferase superfamily protein [Kribbella albertanoniae]
MISAIDTCRVPAGRLRGAGVDLLDQQRFALAARRTGPAWLRRIFATTEWDAEQLPGTAELAHLARMFGIKECVVKVVGGLPAGACYRDIIVGRADTDGVRLIGLRGELANDHRVVLTGGVLPADDALGPDLALCWAVATEVEAAR